ncbi:MAG TPA: acyltransferase [Anaerolineales bacterium]|nr:acyltransferase [Anaerolineales bacterium]
MFGLLRTIFAVMVASYHLFYPMTALGVYPVFGFYVISGYLMTLILQERYGYSSRGRSIFAINRFLRIYPQYWASASVSVLLIYLLGNEFVRHINTTIFLPKTPLAIGQNIFLAFLAWEPGNVIPRLVPPTWTLTVEIIFYGLIGAGISRSFTRTKIWFSFSVVYVIGSYVIGLPWVDRYAPCLAASLPFSMGAGIYFLTTEHSRASKLLLKIPASLWFLFTLGNCLLFGRVPINSALGEVGFYFNLIFCTLLVYRVAQGGKIFPLCEKLDRQIGNFSYPIYILHAQAGILASFLFFDQGDTSLIHRLVNLLTAFVILFFLSQIFIIVLDNPIHRIRTKLKDKMLVSTHVE